MENSLTYMKNQIRAYPVASAVLTCAASLLIGWGATITYSWYTRVPASAIGILGVNANISDKNGDGITDAMVTTSEGYNHLTLGRGNGFYTGLKGLEKEFKDAEAVLNHDLSRANKYIPTFRDPPKTQLQPLQPPAKPTPQNQSTQPTRPILPSSDFYEQPNPAIFNPNEYHPKPEERTTQASSSRLENLAGLNLAPVHLNQ